MAVLLAALGTFIYLRFGSQLNETIDQGLRSRADEVAALVSDSRSPLGREAPKLLSDRQESFAQVLTPAGQVVDTTPQLGDAPVLAGDPLRAASARAIFVERSGLPGVEGEARLLAAPAASAPQPLVVVVGASIDDRREALAGLATLLLIGGPIGLVLASLAGYGMATAAMRPVEAMRRRAAVISADESGERLPVPRADDELRRLGETLNGMLGRLEAAIERERTFVDDASHELRTPLALHKTELELALRYGATTGELKASVASAIEEADRLIALAEGLLVVARSEKGRLALESAPVAVQRLLEDVASRFEARAQESGRALRVEVPPGELVIDADRLRVEQALTNLTENALRHGDGEVRLWARRDGDRLALGVSDRGAGFPPEFIDRAFDRFTRADSSRARGGSGLGLAIVDSIARAHRGDARAANRPEGSTDVWIELPDAFTCGSRARRRTGPDCCSS